jgi:3-phosphoshikimate 1-carboxyvinyltransferase
MEFIDLPALSGARGKVRLPGSKSISNRMLLLAALAQGSTRVSGLLDSDDTQVMLESLTRLGVQWQRLGNSDDYQIDGIGGTFPVKQANLFLGNAGTAFRSLTAATALAGGHYTLTGVERMHERPIGDLVDALRQLGAQITYLGDEGFPPLSIAPARVAADAAVDAAVDAAADVVASVKGHVSSQYLTGMLLSAPLLGRAVTIRVEGELISKPYVEITLNLMRRFGVEVQRDGWQSFTVPASVYRSPGEIEVEGDASSASYFLAAGALGHGPVRVEGVGRNSIQGDVRFAEALARMGAEIGFGPNWIESRLGCGSKLQAIDLDCNHIPDAAMTLAVLAVFADGVTTLRNIASWRVKETDRIAAMATELRKVGAKVEEGADFIRVTPPAKLISGAVIDTYDDHRMAMCFSLISLGGVSVRINEPKCVAKTFPTYFNVFNALVQTATNFG